MIIQTRAFPHYQRNCALSEAEQPINQIEKKLHSSCIREWTKVLGPIVDHPSGRENLRIILMGNANDRIAFSILKKTEVLFVR